MYRYMRWAVMCSVLFSTAGFAASVGDVSDWTAGDPTSWDLLDLDFGSDAGKTTLAAHFTDLYGNTAPETLAADSTIPNTNNAAGGALRMSTAYPIPSTLEVRFASPVGTFAELRNIRSGGLAEFSLRWRTTDIYESGFDAGTDIAPAGVVREEFNVYRFVLDEDESTGDEFYTLFINDDTPITVVSSTVLSDSPLIDLFFDPGQWEIDYIRHANGAYALIPEPASLALLGLCGMLMLRRRR